MEVDLSTVDLMHKPTIGLPILGNCSTEYQFANGWPHVVSTQEPLGCDLGQ